MKTEEWTQTLGTVSRNDWIMRNGMDHFMYYENEEDIWETIIPIQTMGRVVLLKTYVEGVPMLKTHTQFDSDVPENTEAFVALWEYEVNGVIHQFPESVYLERMEAERRIFELRGEWSKKAILVDMVSIEDDGDRVNIKELPAEWYEKVKPMFKVKRIIINQKETDEKANQKDQ